MKTRRYYVVMFILLFLGVVGCNTGSKGPGPNLLSEKETIQIAKQEAALIAINSVEMSTAGPIYRVVFGTDADGVEKAVWVSENVEFIQPLEAGISREEAWKIAINKGLENDTELQLIYLPKDISHSFLSEGVYWWFMQSSNEPSQRTLYLNFYTGVVVREDG